MVKFGERLRELASKLGIEEQKMASDLGLTKSQMSHYINGNRKVPSELLQKIVDVYKINPLFLFRTDEDLFVFKEDKVIYEINDKYTYFPTAISAGQPLDIEGLTKHEVISLPDTLLGKHAGHKDLFFAHINGDSMDRLMPDESLIGIKPVNIESLRNGDIVVFSDNYDYSVKHYYRYGDTLVFKPNSNSSHDEIECSINDDIKIHGKVVMYIVNLD